MRCTSCSANVKPIVCVDIDGTLGDFHRHFINFANAYFGRTKPTNKIVVEDYDGSVRMKQWFCEAFGCDARVWHDIKLAYRQGAQKRSMPCFGWSPELTWDLRTLGAEIWITTTRPYQRLDNIDPDTRFWLDRNNIAWDHMIYDEDKWGQLAEQVDGERVVAAIDDLHEELERCFQIFGEHVPILKRANHNRIHQPLYGGNQICHEGRTALVLIQSRLANWRRGRAHV